MRNLTKLAGLACASSLLTWGASATLEAQDGLGFTDVRVGGGPLPTSGIGGGKYFYRSTDFDDGFRMSATLIGPLCNLTPVGCDTVPRPNKSVIGGDDDSALGYIAEIEGDDFADFGNTSYTYDLLMGLEVSYNSWSKDGEGHIWGSIYGPFFEDPLLMMLVGFPALAPPLDLNTFLLMAPGLGEPAVDLSAYALTLQFGWGFEIDTRFDHVWHVEILGFGGAGLAEADWTDATTGAQDSDEGLYVEIGAKLGTYLTHILWVPGLQVGIQGGVIYQNSNCKPFGGKADLSVAGFMAGASVGYRF